MREARAQGLENGKEGKGGTGKGGDENEREMGNYILVNVRGTVQQHKVNTYIYLLS